MHLPSEAAVETAKQAIFNAYAPYSNFLVGAAVQTRQGKIYYGCNIENSSFGLTVCAERVALWKAVSEGQRDVEILAVFAQTQNPIVPCGACLQVLSEFNPKMRIVMATEDSCIEKYIDELLTHFFTLHSNGKRASKG